MGASTLCVKNFCAIACPTCKHIALRHSKFNAFFATSTQRPRGPMDKASAYGAGDCRFESCRGQYLHERDMVKALQGGLAAVTRARAAAVCSSSSQQQQQSATAVSSTQLQQQPAAAIGSQQPAAASRKDLGRSEANLSALQRVAKCAGNHA